MTFTQDSPLATSSEIARRILTPLTFRAVQKTLAAGSALLRKQPIDLAREKFVVYLPAAAPPKAGYGLLVFVAPWEDATKPRLWRPPLDRHGLIFVSATNSGNETSLLDRRVPLALLAVENVRARYRIDPSRVYAFGLSGGSRVAEVVALAYPDVFAGRCSTRAAIRSAARRASTFRPPISSGSSRTRGSSTSPARTTS